MIRQLSIHTTLSLLIILNFGGYSYAAPSVDFGVNVYGPECFDGIDNDGDGFTDWPDDTTCGTEFEDSEGGPIVPRFSENNRNDNASRGSRGGFYLFRSDDPTLGESDDGLTADLIDLIKDGIKAIGENLGISKVAESTEPESRPETPPITIRPITERPTPSSERSDTKPTLDNEPEEETESSAVATLPITEESETPLPEVTGSESPPGPSEPITGTKTSGLPLQTDLPTLPPIANLAAWATAGLFFGGRPAYLLSLIHISEPTRPY